MDETLSAGAAAERNSRTIGSKVLQWFLFGVVFGVLPLIVRVLNIVFAGESLSLTRLLGDGELLISSAAISAGALGELFFASFDRRTRVYRTIVGFMSVIICICTSVAYAQVHDTSSPSIDSHFDVVVGSSLALFLATVLVAGACVALAVGR